MTSHICRWCDRSTHRAVKVGLEHVASTGGHELFACPVCLYLWGLLPYDEHPQDSDGRIRYREDDLPLP